ncbi:MAG: hypothetical protein JOZ62_23715 [Acidobacteriaceae bacterium]|nr:hypothetical protein [Acidobacteriaceae bacterium]
MKSTFKSAMALAVVFSAAVSGAELRPETAREWDEYLLRAHELMVDRIERNFLWVDESEQRLERVRAGSIIVAPIQPKMPIPIRHGLVHHWIGAAFIPGMHIEDVIATVREYDRYAYFYAPAVTGAQVIEVSEDPEHAPDRFTLTFVNKSFFSKHALECESKTSYTRLDAQRWYSQSHTVRVQEWTQYGSSREHMLPAGEGTGYLWSASTVSRFEERDGGVYVEMEAIALSREVPTGMGELVNPIIRRVSKSTLATSLDETRKAVQKREVAANNSYANNSYKVAER